MEYSRAVRVTLHLLPLLLLIVPQEVAGNNPPPGLRSSKDWFVTEDEEVGSVVTRLVTFNDENNTVTFKLEPHQLSDTIHQYFAVDSRRRVVVAKPLTGLLSPGERKRSYILRVRLVDGRLNPVTEVRVQVARAGETPSQFGPGMFDGPSGFRGELPQGFPEANYPLFSTPEPKTVPLLLVNKTWYIWEGAPADTLVDFVVVKDLSGDGYSLALHDPTRLLQMNSETGQVTVATPPTHQQVGSHIVKVTASSPQGTALEEVRVQVLAVSPPTVSTFSVPGQKNQQDLHVVGNGVVPGAGVSGNSSTEPPNAGEVAGSSVTIIPILVVVGMVPLVVAAFWCWRRHHRLAKAHSKKSAVIYDKEEEAAATVEPREQSDSETRNSGGSITGLAALWWRRASSNTYEDSFRGSKKRGSGKVSQLSADAWEFPRHRLKFMGILGEGCFGQVWKCDATGLKGERSMLVAVKTLKESAGERERKDLVQELKVLKSLGQHPNVLSLLGCCTDKDPFFIILEYMVIGKLQSHLRSSRADTPYNNLHGSSSSLTPRDLTHYAYQTARGMEFLSRNGVIHRDLAARNVLVGEEKVCKVADFGFARDLANNRIYERKSDGRLPIRWMAPESLFDNIFTTKSDVWSFGVLLWEIVTLGSTPYPGMGATEVMRKVREGYRLEKPVHCRREIYNIMYYCWDKDPNERPSFTELVHTLEGLLMSEVEYIELDRFPDHTYYNISQEKADELL
uniref:receptor protein-tyrosine kinase n=1 Tax=Gecarcinus lateralis TaxID=6769 RepID=A0AAU0N4Z7_GECLA